MKQIQWKTKALRQLRKIRDIKVRNDIYDAVGELINFPDCENVKKIKTTNMYRLRAGNYRIFFTDSFEIVTIEEVKKRNERTYK